jgi:hypothetical protein
LVSFENAGGIQKVGGFAAGAGTDVNSIDFDIAAVAG